MIGHVGFSKRGQQAPADRWVYDFRKGFLPPGTDSDPRETQVVLPHDFNPLEAGDGFHVLRTPAGTQAPVEHINYTPATGEVHDRGARAPVQYENLSLIPEKSPLGRGVGVGEAAGRDPNDIGDLMPGGASAGPTQGPPNPKSRANGTDAQGRPTFTDPAGFVYYIDPMTGWPELTSQPKYDSNLGVWLQKDGTTGHLSKIDTPTPKNPTETLVQRDFPDGTARVLKPGSDPTQAGNWVVVGRKDDPNKPTNVTFVTLPNGETRLKDENGATYDPQTGKQLTPGIQRPGGAQSGSTPGSTPTDTQTGRQFTDSPLETFARQQARSQGLDPDIFAAQLNQENGFKPTGTSSKGAGGVAQFMPETARSVARMLGVSEKDFWADPKLQIQGAAVYMKYLTDKYHGNYQMALAAYNTGEGNLDKYGLAGVLDPSYANGETSRYVGGILGQADKIKGGIVGQQVSGGAPGGTTTAGAGNPFVPKEDQKGTFTIQGGYIVNSATGAIKKLPEDDKPMQVGNQIVQRNPQTGSFEVVYEAPTNMQLQPVGDALIAFNPRTGTGTVIAKAPGQVKYEGNTFIVPAGTVFHYTDMSGKEHTAGSYDDPHGLKVGDTVGFGNPSVDQKTGALVDGGLPKGKPGGTPKMPPPWEAGGSKPEGTTSQPTRPDLSATSAATGADNDLVNSRIGAPQAPTAAQEAGRHPWAAAAAPTPPPEQGMRPTPTGAPPIAPPGYTPGATLTEDQYRTKIAGMNGGQDVLGPQTVPPTPDQPAPPPQLHPDIQQIINMPTDADYGAGAWTQGQYGPPEIIPGVSPIGPDEYPVGGGEDAGGWGDPQAVQQAIAPQDGWTPPIPPDQIVGGGNKFGEQTPMEGTHEGTDLQAYQGTPAISPVNGVVVDIKDEPEGLGVQVAIRDSAGQIHRLSHLSDVTSQLGQEVIAGDQVGTVGASGAGATGPHLDYRVEDQAGNRLNPEPMMGDLAQLPPHPDTIERGSPEDMGMQPPGMGEDPRMRRAYDVGGPDPDAQPEGNYGGIPALWGADSSWYPTEDEMRYTGPSDEANFDRDPWAEMRRGMGQYPMERVYPGQQRYDVEGNYADPGLEMLPPSPYPSGAYHDNLSPLVGGGEDNPWDYFLQTGDFGSPSSMREHVEGAAGLRPVGAGEDVYGMPNPDYYAYLNAQLQQQARASAASASASRHAADTAAKSSKYAADIGFKGTKYSTDAARATAIMQNETQAAYYASLDRYYQGQLTNQGRQLDINQQDIELRHQDLQDQLKLGYAQLDQQIKAENDQHQVNLANAQTADAQERENERHNAVAERLQKATLELQAHESALDRANQRIIQGTFGQQQQAKLLQSALANPWTQNLTGMAPGFGKPGWSQDSGGALKNFLQSWNPQPNVVQGIAGDYEALQNDVQSGGAWQPSGGWGFLNTPARASTENLSADSVGGQMGGSGTPGGGTRTTEDMVTLADGSQMSRSQALQAGYQPWDAKAWGSFSDFRSNPDKAARQQFKQQHGIKTGVTYFGTGEDSWADVLGVGENGPGDLGHDAQQAPNQDPVAAAQTTTPAMQKYGLSPEWTYVSQSWNDFGQDLSDYEAAYQRGLDGEQYWATRNPQQAAALHQRNQYVGAKLTEMRRMYQISRQLGLQQMLVPHAYTGTGELAQNPFARQEANSARNLGRKGGDFLRAWDDPSVSFDQYENSGGALQHLGARYAGQGFTGTGIPDNLRYNAPTPPTTGGGTPPDTSGGVGGGNIGTNTPATPAAGGGQGSQAGAGWGGQGLYVNPPTNIDFNAWQQFTPYEQASYRTLAEASEPWAQAQQQMREHWANQGIYETPGTTPLSIASWTPEQRMTKENTAEVFGETPENYWQRQSKVWQNSAASALTQVT